VTGLILVRPTARHMKTTHLALLLLPLIYCTSACAEYEPIDITHIRDKIKIRFHQKFTIVFDQRGNRLVNPRLLTTSTKQPYIVGEFVGTPKGNRALMLQSTFPKMVRYHAAARGEGRRDWHRVNRMYGLLPNVGSAEGFGDPIEEFVLYDFTLTNEKLNQNSTNETIGW
jgi:hypothetical protein